MRVKQIPSLLLQSEGRRLDTKPYMSGALETRLLLSRLPGRKDPLRTLTHGYNGGIYNGPKFSRRWATSPEFGVPFVGSSAMLMSDLSGLPLLSKKEALSSRLSFLRLSPGMTLISCSGTIGRMVYARPDMDGIWSSQHIMKVVPDPGKIPPGYLFAFLSSKYGVPLIVSGTYGSIIQSIEPHHIADLPVPRVGDEIERGVHELITAAAAHRSQASDILAVTRKDLVRRLGLPKLVYESVQTFCTVSVSSFTLNRRLDAPYHSSAALDAEAALDSGRFAPLPLPVVVKRCYKPPIFKRLWVDDPYYGRQFVSGNTAYHLTPDEARFVSRQTPGFEDFVLHRGWVVFQAAGQIYGLFGQPLFVYGWLENCFCADDMYRLVPYSEEDGAFLYAFFSTIYGQVLLKRQACGNSIPRIWDPHMPSIRVPWPDLETRQAIAGPIVVAHERMEQARLLERQAVQLVEQAIEGAA